MSRTKIQLGLPDLAPEIELKYRQAKTGWEKSRLLCLKLACEGKHNAHEIADLSGCGITRVFDWLRLVRKEKSLDSLLTREKPGPRDGGMRALQGKPEVIKEIKLKLESGGWASVVQFCRWLKSNHQVEVGVGTAWKWLKKLGGVLRVPRPKHPGSSDEARAEFKATLEQKLDDLNIPQGSTVKVWVMDEARFGLHTEIRRLWIKKGVRPVVTKQIKYQWEYLFGSLEVEGGAAHFMHMPGVDLETDRIYLEQLAETDVGAVHVVIRDQAGFHLGDGDERLPERVRIVPLPPYSPELNPCEQLWDVIKDETANHVHKTVEELREAMKPTLVRYWKEPMNVIQLIGREWLVSQVNVLH